MIAGVASPAFRLLLVLLSCLSLQACETAYYGAMEKVGVHKRDIMTDRIEEARDAQEEAKQEFRSALERFSTELGFDGGDLEDKYETLNDAFESSESQAQAVSDRIDAVESVAEALFDEWDAELADYSNDRLRRESQSQLRQTKQRYQRMLSAMHSAEKRMGPVLDTFRDQVLYLKHNLNARAVASLKGEFRAIDADIKALIKKMQKAISESDMFIEQLRG